MELEPGTNFIIIKPDKHIIFKKKVTANGTKEKPIIFKRFDNQKKPWGSLAVLGKNTQGSLFNNVIVTGGSGGKFNQYKFTSMFSIHGVKKFIVRILNFYPIKILMTLFT